MILSTLKFLTVQWVFCMRFIYISTFVESGDDVKIFLGIKNFLNSPPNFA